jgi:hypothetical protein
MYRNQFQHATLTPWQKSRAVRNILVVVGILSTNLAFAQRRSKAEFPAR